MDAARTRIQYLQFICGAGHQFSMPCKQRVRVDKPDEVEQVYQRGEGNWLPVPKCPVDDCPLIGEPIPDPASTRSFAQVPESERFQAWLSPDGERVAVPGYRGAKMPERYRRAGYMTVEASNLTQLQRLEQVRAAQTGNSAYHEMSSFDSASRAARAQAEYSDDLTKDT